MKKVITLAGIAITMTGCVSIPTPVMPQVEHVETPTANAVTSVSLGERMLETGTVTTRKAFKLNTHVGIFDGKVTAGEYVLTMMDGNDTIYTPVSGYNTGIIGVISGLPSPAQVTVSTKNELCMIDAIGLEHCSDTILTIYDKHEYNANSFMQELIYTGKVGDTARFTYREYSNGMARQAFSVDVQYDLSEDSLISYKGATLEVIEATNRKITYKVLNHFK